MRTTKHILLCLFVCLLSLQVATCSAAGPETITMSMQDYQTLKSDFLTLKQNNEKQQQLLTLLKEQLAQAEKSQNLSSQDWLMLRLQLTEAQQKTAILDNQLQTLGQQLASAKQSSLTAEQNLQSANQSLTELTKAIKKERQAAEIRETILKIITAGAIYYAASK